MTGSPKRTFRSALPTIVFALLAHISCAQAPADRLQQVVQPYVDAQMFMGSVLVAKDGKAVFSESYGPESCPECCHRIGRPAARSGPWQALRPDTGHRT